MRAVEASSKNEAVIQQAQNEVRSAQVAITFLEDELAKAQLVGGAAGSPMRGEPSNGMAGRGQGSGMMSPSQSGGASAAMGVGASPSRQGGMERPLPPPPTGDGGEIRKEQKNYTQLGGPALFFPPWGRLTDHK